VRHGFVDPPGLEQCEPERPHRLGAERAVVEPFASGDVQRARQRLGVTDVHEHVHSQDVDG